MEARSTRLQMEELLEHQAWVRALALRLVGDRHLADDLAQETVVLALEQRPGGIQAMRAWMGTVLRNLVRERARTDASRQYRERDVAAREATASTLDMFERVSAHKSVVEAVMDLPEHYRAALLLRYFDGLTPMQIAERLQLPLSTIKTRLARGLAAMRERLDRDAGGDGSSWLQGLLPLTLARDAAPLAPAFPLVWCAKLALGTILIVSLGWSLWPTFSAEQAVTQNTEQALLPALGEAAVISSGAVQGTSTDHEQPGERNLALAQEAEPLRPVEPLDYPLRGRVVDMQGRPQARLVLSFEARFKGGTAIAISAKDGSFEFRDARGTGTVRAMGEAVVTLFAGQARAGEADQELQVVVLRGSRLAGEVVDANGRPVTDAEVAVVLDDQALVGMRGGQSNALLDLRFVLSNEDGEFDLGVAIDLAEARLQVRAEGFEDLELPRPIGAQENLRLEMVRRAPGPDDVRGRVVAPQGAPLADCRVALGGVVTRTNAAGEFHLPREAQVVQGEAWISAHAGGYGPAVKRLPPASEGPQIDVLLQLLPEPLTLAGRVFDAAGEPCAGLDVFLEDATVFSYHGDFDGSLSSSDESGDRLRSRDLRYELLEDLAAGHAGKGLRWTRTRTDERGAFLVGGLAARGYRIALLDRQTLRLQVSHELEPGGDAVRLLFESAAGLVDVRGVVLDTNGVPIPGVRVNAWGGVHRVGLDKQSQVTTMHTHSSVTTDSAGRFALGRLALDRSNLNLAGEGWIQRSVKLSEAGDSMRIELRRRHWVRVLLADPDRADAYALVAEDGTALPLLLDSPGRAQLFQRMPLIAGRSDIVGVSQEALECVLYRDGLEVGRSAVQFSTGGTTVLEF